MDIMKSLYWISACFIVYAYAGYPVVIWLLSLLVPDKSRDYSKPFLPKVTLLISAYNEAPVIEDKIINSLSIHYPKELLEIMVVSDGSDDGTNESVGKYEKQGVVLKYYEGRIGKTACLNHAVAAAQGEILIFSDANSLYDKNAIINIVENFADDKIGFVTGHTRYFAEEDDSTWSSIGIYSKIEKLTKKAESKFGSCVGADGAIFAIRKHLYKPLRDFDINDFVIPLQVIRQGFKGVFEENAFCTEKTAGNAGGEFKRQIRITNRTLRALMNNIALFNPLAYGIFSFELFSHKVVKFLSPFFAIILICSNIVLINSGIMYRLFLLAQVMLILMASLGHVSRGFNVLSRLSSICNTFVTMNLAILGGWYQFLNGETYTTWLPIKR
jgi:cellulose synthase/poly-beta-1,6-N-acetylglucosamine synthase-like glycosyltransferase